MLLLLAIAPGVLRAQAAIDVPRGQGVTVDGKLGDREWAGSVESALPDSSRLYLRHDGSYLYVGIRARSGGFPSICAARQDTVRILHSSAALAMGTFAGPPNQSRLVIPFGGFQLRGNDTSAKRRTERKAFLDSNRWLASNSAASQTEWETQIALAMFDRGDPRLALGFYRAKEDDSVAWPAGVADACTALKTVQGFLPIMPVAFDTGRWMRLKLR